MVFRSLPAFLVSSLAALSYITSTTAFSFTTGSLNSCDPVEISWSGGTAPFSILLTPVFGTPRNISMPTSSFSNGKGSYTIEELPFPSSQKMMMVMSDSTGLGTGGTTGLLTVGKSTTSASCNTTDPGVDFPFQLNTALQQCRAYTFSGYSDAIQPVTIMGLIPDGDAFALFPPKGVKNYDWNADVFNGTDIIFLMVDAEGRQGGSSDVKTVGISDDNSCISSSSPSVTADPEDSTTPSSTGVTTALPSSDTSSTPIGAIAGTVLGALIFFAVVISFVLFFIKRRQAHQHAKYGGGNDGTDFSRHSRRLQSEVDLVGTAPTNATQHSGAAGYNQTMSMSNLSSDPFSSPQDVNVPPFMDHTTPFTATASSSTSPALTSAQRKAAQAGATAYKPSRYILHTDLEDEPSAHEEEEVVELPPQYSERRVPADYTAPPSSSRLP